VTLVVRPTVRGVLTHTAGVSATGSDPNLANNSSSLDVDVKDKSKPAVSAFRRTKAGFSYKLSEPARVVIKVARKCKKGKSGCKTGFKTAKTLRQDGKKGKNSRALPRKGLKPGRYRATLVARDPAGNASAPKRVGFALGRAS
jgi:hypothetical protein